MVNVYLGLIPIYLVLGTAQCFPDTTTQLPQTEDQNVSEIRTTSNYSQFHIANNHNSSQQIPGSNDGVRGHTTATPDVIHTAEITTSNGRYDERTTSKNAVDEANTTVEPAINLANATETTQFIRKVKEEATKKNEEDFVTDTTPGLAEVTNSVTPTPNPTSFPTTTNSTETQFSQEPTNETPKHGSTTSLQNITTGFRDADNKIGGVRIDDTHTNVLKPVENQPAGTTSGVNLFPGITSTIKPEAHPTTEQTTSGYTDDIITPGRTTSNPRQNVQSSNLHLNSIFQKSPFLSSHYPRFGLRHFFQFSPLSQFVSQPTLAPFHTTGNLLSAGIPSTSVTNDASVNNVLQPSLQRSKGNHGQRSGRAQIVGTRPRVYSPRQESTVQPTNINLNQDTRTTIPGHLSFGSSISDLNSMVQRHPGSEVLSKSATQPRSGSDVISNLNAFVQRHPGSDSNTGQSSAVKNFPGSEVITNVNSAIQHHPGSGDISTLDSFVQHHPGSDVITDVNSRVQRHPESDVITDVNSSVRRHPGSDVITDLNFGVQRHPGSDVNTGFNTAAHQQTEHRISAGPQSSSNFDLVDTNESVLDSIPSLPVNSIPLNSIPESYHSPPLMDEPSLHISPVAFDRESKTLAGSATGNMKGKILSLGSHTLPIAPTLEYDDLRDDSFYDEYSLDPPLSDESSKHKASGLNAATITDFVGTVKAPKLGSITDDIDEFGSLDKWNDEYDPFDDVVEYPTEKDSSIKDYDAFEGNLDDFRDDHFDRDYGIGDDDFYNDDLDYFNDDKITGDDSDIMDDVDEAEDLHHMPYQRKHPRHLLKNNIWQLSEFPKTDSLSEEMLDDPEDFPKSFSRLGSRLAKAPSRFNNLYNPSRKPVKVRNTNMFTPSRIQSKRERDEKERDDFGDESEFDDLYKAGDESEDDAEDIPISGRRKLGKTLQERFGNLINIYRKNLDKGQKKKPVKSFSNVKALLKTYNNLVAMRGAKSKKKPANPNLKSKTPNPKLNRAKQVRRLERIKRLMRIASERSAGRSMSNRPGRKETLKKDSRNVSTKRFGSKPKDRVYHHPRNPDPKLPDHQSKDKLATPITTLNKNLFHFPALTDFSQSSGIANVNAQNHLLPSSSDSLEAGVQKLMSEPITHDLRRRIVGEESDGYDDMDHYDDHHDDHFDNDDDDDDDDDDVDDDRSDDGDFGDDYEYEMDEDEREEEDFLARMFGLQNIRPKRKRMLTNAHDVCPSLPIKVENSTVKITTADGCQLVITFNEQTGVHVGTSRETFGVKMSYREN